MKRRLGGALLASLALWPLLPLISTYWPAAAPLEHALGAWFDLHCERDPARTLTWFGVPLAVCARCSGIYFGLGVGVWLRWPGLAPAALRAWVLAAAALMLADVALELGGVHGAWEHARLLTGVLLAYPVGVGLGHELARAPTKTSAQSP